MESIHPSDKGIRRLMFSFLSFDINGSFPLVFFQVLASLAQRYSLCLRGLRAFVQPLYSMCRGSNNLALKKASSAARFSIEVWRAVSMMLYQDSNCLSVPLRSLVPSGFLCDFSMISDAGPRGLGAAIFDSDGVLLIYTSFVLPFDAADPKFQNCREYMGFLMCLVLLHQLRRPCRGAVLAWRTDNKAALSWVEENMCRSDTTQVALMAVTWMTIKSSLEVREVSHLPGVQMGIIDDLSRQRAHSWPVDKSFDSQNNSSICQLFRACDPTNYGGLSEPNHAVVFSRVVALVDVIVSHR